MADNVISLEEAATRLQRGQRLLGLDLGTKTIGLALSDIEFRIATAMKTLKRTKFREDAAALVKIAGEHQIAALVLGLPLNMDGSEGPRAQATRAFVRNLAPILPLPVIYWDERLSTVAAERALIAADMSRVKRGAVIDATAAAFILQGALDRLANLRG
ncbi:MAG: Holliday junction resolvase RuvX [Proteobacteria bacterium]|nr:Holliday junction resolvase RuvX [Pseudomonadota bacterium]